MTETYKKAGSFLYRNARPLDLARWQYHFENGSRAAVVTALKKNKAGCKSLDAAFSFVL
ncbi:MAG: hypothetical protein ACI4V1_06740 [Eubacteriales bacterium]